MIDEDKEEEERDLNESLPEDVGDYERVEAAQRSFTEYGPGNLGSLYKNHDDESMGMSSQFEFEDRVPSKIRNMDIAMDTQNRMMRYKDA